MGEVIKVLSEMPLGSEDDRIVIELNHSTSRKKEREIHIQNSKFRLAMPEKDFLQIASSFLVAEKNMNIIKKVNNRWQNT